MTQQPRETVTEQLEGAGFFDQLKLAGAIVAGAALILFLFQNMQRVEINFLWMDWHTRMIWALIASALLGAIAMLLALTIRGRRRVRTVQKR